MNRDILIFVKNIVDSIPEDVMKLFLHVGVIIVSAIKRFIRRINEPMNKVVITTFPAKNQNSPAHSVI